MRNKAQTEQSKGTFLEQVAADVYKVRAARSQELLKRIAERLEEHAKEQALTPKNWGHAGDLGKINEDLAEMLAFLGDHSAIQNRMTPR